MEKNSIKSVLIIPYSPITCRYYLNSSNDAHATTYEKVSEMLSSLAPWSAQQVFHLMERKLSFYIDLEQKTLQEVRPDEQQVIDQNRQEKLEMNQSNINKFLKENKNKVDNIPKYSILLNAIQNKLWRK